MTPDRPRRRKRIRRRLKQAVRWARAHLPRLVAPSGPVLVNSVPKSGTNLLRNVVKTLPGVVDCGNLAEASVILDPDARLEFLESKVWCVRRGCLYAGHVQHTEATARWLDARGFRHLLIVRDPRDVTVSLYHYEMRPHHPFHELWASFENDKARLMAAIEGYGPGANGYRVSSTSIPNVASMFDEFMPWSAHPAVLTVRFEDLVEPGEAGRLRAREVLAGILEFLGLPVRERLIDRMMRRGMAPKRSATFRQGRAGAWRAEYTPQHVEAFRRVAGDLAERLGYRWD